MKMPTHSPKAPIAIISALSQELSGVRSALSSAKILHHDHATFHAGLATPTLPPGLTDTETDAGAPRTAIAAVVGMGQRHVESALKRLFDDWNPSAVSLIGFAGGCVADAAPGDLYVCNPMLVEPPAGPDGVPIEGRSPLEPDRAVLDAFLRAAAAAGRPLKVGASVTVNVIATPRAKDSLGRNRGAALCDMESFWAARFCAGRGVPFAALRAIFDGTADPLPQIPGLGQEGLLSIVRRRPGVLLSLPRLALRFRKVSRALDPVARALVGEMAGL